MRRTKLKVAIVSTALVGVGVGWAVPAVAASVAAPKGTTISTSTSVKTVVSARCYHTHQVTVTTYHWSKKTGWTKYAAPKKTVTDSTTCH